MGAAWILQRKTGNAGWVDVLWPISMAAIALIYAVQGEADGPVRFSIAVMVGTWAARLAVHVGKRVAGEAEDPRYRELRRWFGRSEQPGLLAFYQLQALAALPLSLPWLIAINRSGDAGVGWLGLAWLLWITAMIGEWISDRQLSRHRANPRNRGKTCRTGLWRYSRHPNYFFEWLHWLSYPPLCIGAPLGWLSLLSPIVMILFLIFVTGIPHTERRALRSRGEDYRRYQQSTSAFFPWFPKETQHENQR